MTETITFVTPVLAAGKWLPGPKLPLRLRDEEDAMNEFVRTAANFEPGAQILPGRYYCSPDVLAEETERLFVKRVKSVRGWQSRRDSTLVPECSIYYRFSGSRRCERV